MTKTIKRFCKDMNQYYSYSIRLARADLRTEVANSYLNWLWWLIDPLSMMFIYAFIFGVVFQSSEDNFPLFIFIGITVWSYFSHNMAASVRLIRGNMSIISKIYIPKYILLFSEMLVNAFKMLISFGMVILMMIMYKVQITSNILFIIPIMIDLFLISFAMGSILLHYGVYVKDLPYIVDIVLRMLMYFTGTFYSLAKRIPAPYGELIEKANPVAYLIAAARNALLYGQGTSWQILILWALLSLVLLYIGVSLIYRYENSYARDI